MSQIESLVSVFAIRNGRRKMEDKHVVIPDLNEKCNLNTQKRYSFYAVYDGHGGVDAANFCAENLHQILCKTRSFHEGNIEKALRETFIETDRLFCSSLLKTQSGCTAIICLREIVEDGKQTKLYFAWAGDSQAVLVREGTAIDVTPPHKPDDDKEITRIESLGGVVIKSDCFRVNGLLAVSRAIGDASHKPYITADPEIRVETLIGSEDFMILACDGLWDEVDCDDATQMVYEAIQDSSDPEVSAKSVAACLGESAKNQGSADNITVIVVFLRSLRDILPTTSFNNDTPKIEVINKKKEEELLFGLEPVQLRVKREDGNLIQGNGEDGKWKALQIAGDSMDAFKNGNVASTLIPPLHGIDPLPQELPSPTLQCLADSTTVNETMNNNESQASSIFSSSYGKHKEETIPPLIKSDAAIDSTCPTTASSSSCFVTPSNVSADDLLQFSFTPGLKGEEKTVELEPPSSSDKMDTNHLHEIFSPLFPMKTDSKNEEIRIEEEFEETTVTTEAVFDPVPMTRTTEKIFSAPSAFTSLRHEFSSESRPNGRPPSPEKPAVESTRESYSISSPSGKEKVVRVSGDFSKNYESLIKKESKEYTSNLIARDLLEQVKETKVFEIDTVINNSLVPESLVHVHQVQLESQRPVEVGSKKIESNYASGRKEVSPSSMNGLGMTSELLLESSNVVTSTSEVASSFFQASSNGFDRAFLECESSQNLSKDESRMKDFSPIEKDHTHKNNDYLTLSAGAKGGLSPLTKVRDAPNDVVPGSDSITKLIARDSKELLTDLKPLSPNLSSETTKSPVKRATSPTASSRAKEVSKAKAPVSAAVRTKPSSTTSVTSKSTAAKSTVSKPNTMTKTSTTASTIGSTFRSSRPVTSNIGARTTTRPSTIGAPTKFQISPAKLTTALNAKPTSRTSSAPRLSSVTAKISTSSSQPEPIKASSTTSSIKTRVKPGTSSTTTRTLPVKSIPPAAKTIAPKMPSTLSRSSASTSALRPVTSKVDSGLSSIKTVRLNVLTTSGLKSTSTSGPRIGTTGLRTGTTGLRTTATSSALKPAIKKVEPVKLALRVAPSKKTINSTKEEPKSNGTNV